MESNPPRPMLWQNDESLRGLAARLAERPSCIRLVSFDFFDTLVSRLCAEPSDLFIEVGRQLAQCGLMLTPLSPPEFRAARIAADERARDNAVQHGRGSELKLADIYQELKQVVRDPTAARDLEFDIERSFCYLNPAMASLVEHVRELGLKTAILSDTYFTAAELGRILRENGLPPALFHTIITSCEKGEAKWNGMLYHELFRHFDVHPSEVLHIGDNAQADIAMARQFGVNTLHYYKTTPNLDVIFNGERTMRGTQAHPAGSLNSLRALTARQAKSDEDPFRDGALTFGPLLTRYADWCVRQFKASGVRTVLALMREGELLGELLDRSARAAGVELDVVPCFVSRMSTARAAMREATPETVAELLEGNAFLTTDAVMQILGLGEEAAQAMDAEVRRKPLASAEAVAGLLKFLFQLPGLRQKIEARRAESHSLAFSYLTSLIGEEGTVGVVDLGWSGSIQRNCARILRNGGRQIKTVGCYLACTKRAGRLALDGDEAHAYMEHEWARSTILPEVAITACVGSTDGYRRDASGQVVPVLGPFQISPEERDVKQRLRDGILAFQTNWLALRAAKGAKAYSPEVLADMDQQSASILYRLLEFPTKPEADRLGVLRHDENYFGQNHSAPLCDDQSALQLRHEGAQSLFLAARCYWPQGVVARSHPRLVSALRSGWTDPSALGRMGTWHALKPSDAGVTDDELSVLGKLLRGLAPAQVVFCGPMAPSLEEILLFLEQQPAVPPPGNEAKSRMVVAGAGTGLGLRPELVRRCAHITTSLEEAATIRAIRAQLVTRGSIVLVVSSDVTATAANVLLNGLAPFLGPQGTILVPGGRFDRHTVGKESRLARCANEWLEAVGANSGYGLWALSPTAGALCGSWIAFRRSPETSVWNRQWMPAVADLAYAEINDPADSVAA